jgi:hypothetical protein
LRTALREFVLDDSGMPESDDDLVALGRGRAGAATARQDRPADLAGYLRLAALPGWPDA